MVRNFAFFRNFVIGGYGFTCYKVACDGALDNVGCGHGSSGECNGSVYPCTQTEKQYACKGGQMLFLQDQMA